MRICGSCRQLLGVDARVCPADGAPAELIASLPNGARLGGHRIERQLGEGGMGFVYEAVHEVLGRRAAIKTLRPELAAIPQIATRFLNEARAANLIDHQNIVSVYDYGDGDTGCIYLVMEFLEGETLEALMRRQRPMPLPLVLHVFGQLARALVAAHARQVVHRDLKPENVFIIAREGNPYFVKLLDFGIAQLRAAGAVPGLTLAGSVMGTPQYMSPEQITGGDVDGRSDVWAMGVMLYRAVTGHVPFSGNDFGALAERILHHPPPLVTELVQVPPALAQLIASCLERRPEARCPSIAALLAGLEGIKRASGFDDAAIAIAVAAGAASPAAPTHRRGEPTYDPLADSLPIVPGANVPAVPAVRPRRARRARLVLVAAIALALCGTAYGLLGRGAVASHEVGRDQIGRDQIGRDQIGHDQIGGDKTGGDKADRDKTGRIASTGPSQLKTRSPAPPVDPQELAQALKVNDLARAHAIAEPLLRGAITSEKLEERTAAIEALARVPVAAMAPLLYAALGGAPDVQSAAARVLGELAPPDATAKLRAALANAGPRLKVELAAALYRLNDRDGRPILRRALDDAGLRLTAASAMAAVGDDAGRAALGEILEASPPGRDAWRRAAAALARLGDDRARTLLAGELAQPDAARSIAAAELLALAGDAAALDRLAQDAADAQFARRGSAALALARLGDRRALDWIGDGARSLDADDRKAALAICGRFATGATTHLATLAVDPDRGVRMSAAAAVLGL